MVVLVIITTVISLTFSETTWLLNFYLLYSIFCKKNIPFKTELALVYCRFAVDTLFYFLCEFFGLNLFFIFDKLLDIKTFSFDQQDILIFPSDFGESCHQKSNIFINLANFTSWNRSFNSDFFGYNGQSDRFIFSNFLL